MHIFRNTGMDWVHFGNSCKKTQGIPRKKVNTRRFGTNFHNISGNMLSTQILSYNNMGTYSL